MSYARWKCRFCEQDITYNGIATAAHYKKHLRQLGIKKYDNNRRMGAGRPRGLPMPKGRIQLRLSQTALDHLKTRAKAVGLTRQDYIENWLVDSQTPERTDDNASSFNNPATAKKKAERANRRAALGDSIKEALPQREPLDAVGSSDTIKQTLDGFVDEVQESICQRTPFGGSFPKPGKK